MNLAEHFAPIAALNLDAIKVKLMHKESGEGWSRAYSDAVEFEYRRFLYLAKKFPHEHTAPLFDVDVFWHYHILDTMKYAADCDAVFGYFLHHFPYVGLRGDDDLDVHAKLGERTRELYEQTYGAPYIQQARPRSSVEGDEFDSQPGAAQFAFSVTAPPAASGAAVKSADREPSPREAALLAFSVTAPPGTAAAVQPSDAAQLAFSVTAPPGAARTAYSANAEPRAAAVFNSARPTL